MCIEHYLTVLAALSSLLYISIYLLYYIDIWLNFEKGGSLDFRLKTGAACFQAIGAAWNLRGRRQGMPGWTPEALSYELVGSLPLQEESKVTLGGG